MAILKDLIVHGSSRFLNKIYASEIQTPLIDADAGVFKKLKADDATVVGLLDVKGQLHTNSWSNSNIATIDGSFYITPTIGSASGTVTITASSLVFSGTNYAVSSLYLGDGSSITWPQYSKVLVTGQILSNGEWIPLGTLLGQLSNTATAASISINNIKDNKNQTSNVLATLVSNGTTSSSYRNLKVSLYQRASSSTAFYPLGIYMTATGTNGRTFLDIYGGVQALNTNNNYGGFAEPNVRIGNLQGLPNVGGQTPSGWGIYTDNGYFKGIIAADRGYIGTGSRYWVIANYEDDSNSNNSRSYIYSYNGTDNGTNSITSTVEGIYLGTDGIRNYKDSTHNVTIANGVITALGVNLTGTINATAGNIGGANITGGVLSVPAANISGTLTASQVDVSGIITAGSIVTDTLQGGTFNTTDYIRVSTQASSALTIGTSGSKTDWRILAGKTFGVDKAGNMYATSATISGNITATSGIIGGASISDGVLYITDTNISGTISGNHIDAFSISIGNLNGASDYAQKSYVDDAVDNIEIGGRNLLKNSNVVNTSLSDSVIGGTATQTIPSGTVITLSVQIDADNVVWSSSGNKRIGVASSIVKDSGGNQYIEAWAAMTGRTGTGIDKTFDTSFHGRVKSTYTLQGELSLDKVFTLYVQSVTSGTVSVSNPKLEIGNKATDWIPAPEDTQENINNVSTTANMALNQSIEYITGTQTAATGTWKGVTTESSLRNGKTIMYYLPVAGSGNASLVLTLADGTDTAAIPIYMVYSTTSNTGGLSRVTTHYPAKSMIQMTYDATANQWKTTGYNTNVDHMDRTQYALALAANMAISAGRIAVLGLDGKLQLLSSSSFDITCPPLYVATTYSAANVTSATTRTTNYNIIGVAFTLTNTHSIQNAVANSNVYIVGILTGNVFTPTATVLTCSEPTTEDGLYYMLLGKMITTSNAILQAEHPIFVYKNGSFQKIEAITANGYITDIDTQRGITIKPYDSSGNDYLQLNSDAINFYRNNIETLRITDSDIRIGKLGTNERNVFITSSSVQIRNNDTNVLASYGIETVFYRPGTNVQALKIDSSNIFVGPESAPHLKLDATSLSAFHDADNVYFTLGNGSSTIEKEYTVEEPSSIFNVINSIDQITSVVYIVNSTDITVTNYEYEVGSTAVNVHHKIAGGNTIEITYKHSDAEDDGTVITTTETFTVPDITLSITLSTSAVTVNSIKVDDTTVVNYAVSSDNTSVSFVNTNIPDEGQVITINYTLANANLSPYFIFGNRNANASFGSGSVSFGRGSSLTGELSLASGWNHIISGAGSVSFGSTNTITGGDSFSTGYFNNVSGKFAAAMGYHAEAQGDYSFAMGHYTKTTQNCSLACGKYNNPTDLYFSVGMGTSASRRNAFGVYTNGDILMHGILYGKVNSSTRMPMFFTKRFTVDNITVPATGGSTVAISGVQNVNVAVDGYIAIGLMSFLSQNATTNGANSTCVFPYAWWINQNYFRFSLRNTVASQVKCKVVFRILYICKSAVYQNWFPSNGDA